MNVCVRVCVCVRERERERVCEREREIEDPTSTLKSNDPLLYDSFTTSS